MTDAASVLPRRQAALLRGLLRPRCRGAQAAGLPLRLPADVKLFRMVHAFSRAVERDAG